MNQTHVVARRLLPALLLIAGGTWTKILIDFAPEPETRQLRRGGLLVEVLAVTKGDYPVSVIAHGTTIPYGAVELAAEVSGRVTWKHPELTEGGQVRRGEVLMRIDVRDYDIALAKEEAAVAQAEAELQLERGRKQVAEQEWAKFGQAGVGDGALAKREPQLRQRKLSLRTAQHGLKQARLQRERTAVRAPFDAIVRKNLTEPGRMVTPQQALAELVEVDVFLVEVSLPVEELRWLRIPGMGTPRLTKEEFADLVEHGATADPSQRTTFARVQHNLGLEVVKRVGFVTGLLGELDPVGRMARVMIAVRDPLGLARPRADGTPEGPSAEDGARANEGDAPLPKVEDQVERGGQAADPVLPLLLGAYVEVHLQGEVLEGVFEVPHGALHDGDQVYLADEHDRLARRQLHIVRRRQRSVLVVGGLAAGDRVIVSPLPTAEEGMELKVREIKVPEKPERSSLLGSDGS